MSKSLKHPYQESVHFCTVSQWWLDLTHMARKYILAQSCFDASHFIPADMTTAILCQSSRTPALMVEWSNFLRLLDIKQMSHAADHLMTAKYKLPVRLHLSTLWSLIFCVSICQHWSKPRQNASVSHHYTSQWSNRLTFFPIPFHMVENTRSITEHLRRHRDEHVAACFPRVATQVYSKRPAEAQESFPQYGEHIN